MSRARWLLAVLATGALACGKDSDNPGEFPDDALGDESRDVNGVGGEDPGGPGQPGRENELPSGPVGYTDDGGAICEEFAVRAAPVIPNVLIVLDRSGSMKRRDRDTGELIVNRWDPSVTAVKAITTQLENDIRFGLMMFPDDDAPLECTLEPDPLSCAGCAPGTLDVATKLSTSTAITSALDSTQPSGGTPTSATLAKANEELTGVAIDPDAPPAPSYVLLVTDGQPTCPNGDGYSDALPEELAADRALTVDAIDALRAEGVKTYVVSYDAALDASLVSALSEFAEHGGTGDYHAVNDQDSSELLSVFEKIAGEVVSCSYQLEMEPPDPSFVQVKLDGAQLNLGADDGWSIKGRAVTIEGAACKSLQDGGKHEISVKVLCQIVAPI